MGGYTTGELERDTGFGRRTIAYYVQRGLLPRVGRRGPRTRYPELVRDRLLFIRCVREAEDEGEIRPVPLNDLRELFKTLPPEVVASVADGEIPLTPDMVSLSSAEQRSMVDRVAALRERLLDRSSGLAAESPPAFLREDEGMPLRAEEGMPRRVEAPRGAEEDWDEAPDRAPRRMFLAREGPELREDFAGARDRYGSPEERDEDLGAGIFGDQLGWVLRELQTLAREGERVVPDVDTWSQVEVTPGIRLSARGVSDEDAFLLRIAGRLLREALEGRASSPERGVREPGE